ncbi:MAG: GNAT family N-acetyltransferase [Bdellovibrio sp.]|nr:GNAT family N-acetyltransferase [Bdellovibrio sp.]
MPNLKKIKTVSYNGIDYFEVFEGLIGSQRYLIEEDFYNDRLKVHLTGLKPADQPEVIAYMQKEFSFSGFSKLILYTDVGLNPEITQSIPMIECEARLNNFGRFQEYSIYSRVIFEKRKFEPMQISPRKITEKGNFKAEYKVFSQGEERDYEGLSELFKNSFTCYPFPIFYSPFLKLLCESTVCSVAFVEGVMAATAVAHIDNKSSTAEIAECCTKEGFRGKGLNRKVITNLETFIKKTGIQSAYALTRSDSDSATNLFRALGFSDSGLLKRNCLIDSSYKDLVFFHKRL